MDRPLKMLTFLLWVFLLSQSHSLVESLPSDQPDRVSFLPNHHDRSTPPRPRPPKKKHIGSPKPPQEPHHPLSGRHHPPPPPPPHQKETRPQDQQRQNDGRKQRKMNSGKKIGVIFLGIGVALQVVVVGVLGFKRWQISKKMKERRWDFTA